MRNNDVKASRFPQSFPQLSRKSVASQTVV
jgi:hypothetical protein